MIFIFTAPIVAFSALRGSSGKDSELYLLRFFSMSSDWDKFSLFDEPILNSLIYFSKHVLGGTHELFFLFHAVLVCFLFSLIVRKYEISRVYLLTVGPMFLIDGITNGMRITLAYHFFIVAALYRKQFVGVLFVMFSHVTGVLMYGFKLIIDSNRVTIFKKVIIFFSFITLAYITSIYFERLLFLMPRVASKLDKYSTMVLSTKYSGLADIFVMTSVSIIAVKANVENMSKFILGGVVAFSIGVLFYIMVQSSLAFIRVGKLYIVSLCLSNFVMYPKKKISFNFLFLVGILYTLNTFRQIYNSPAILPYPGSI